MRRNRIRRQTTSFDPKDILQVQDLPDSEDLGSTTITGNIYLGAERQSPGFGQCHLELAVIAGKHPQGIDPGKPYPDQRASRH